MDQYQWQFSNTEELQFFWKAVEEGNTEGIEKYLNRVLSNSVSVFDTKARNEEKESSYHNLLVGILNAFAWPLTVYRKQRVFIVYCVDYQGI